MKLLRSTGYRRMRWKNGLGETTEIAIGPEDASVARFDWRISMARVEADGPFSNFPGIDRTLTVLDGAGCLLKVGDAPPQVLTPQSPPFTFPGDVPASATLIGGPVTDLNVMTRRGRFSHRVRRVASGTHAVEPAAALVAVFCASGAARATIAGRAVQLGPHDTLIVEPATGVLDVGATSFSEVLFLEIVRC